jgi:hypothetical protein
MPVQCVLSYLPNGAMLKLPLLLFALGFACSCYGQLLQTVPASARTGIYRNVQTNALHFTANQAALGHFKNFAAALYSEKRFLLQELSLFHLALAQPAGDGALGAQLAYSGNADYNTSKISFAYGRNLSGKVDAGIQFNYLNQYIRGYDNASQVTVEGGVVFHFSEVFHAGLQLCNPAGVLLDKTIGKVPALYTAGFTYQPSPQFGITAELVKTDKMPVAVQTGFEYRFAEKLWAKAGINSGTAAFFIAGGFGLKHFSIEAVGSVHPQLGFSPGLLLVFNGMGK